MNTQPPTDRLSRPTPDLAQAGSGAGRIMTQRIGIFTFGFTFAFIIGVVL